MNLSAVHQVVPVGLVVTKLFRMLKENGDAMAPQ